MMKTAIGLMSGTSMDGIDGAVLRTDGIDRIEFGSNRFFPYADDFRKRLADALETAKAIQYRDERPGDLADLEQEITHLHAQAVESIVDETGARPDLIGFHGQTVLHRPEQALTIQLGDGALLARMTGVQVVFDMRANDMVHGGQGAPLVPVYHAALARSKAGEWHDRFPVVFVNIGGISNITYVPETGDPIAFDTGPGNTLIDQWVLRKSGAAFDDGGRIAGQGSVDEVAVSRYLASPFFEKGGPKSLDRLDFTLDGLGAPSLEDGARTLTAVTARAILKAVDHLPQTPRLWIVCGGGRKNRLIVQDLQEGAAATGARVIAAEDAGWNGDFTEAEAWAYLAVRAEKGLPLTWPSTTGCQAPVSGGRMAKP